jgi:hypothetical protein
MSSPTARSIAAAPPPAAARSTAARRRGLGFGVVNEGLAALAYCLEAGVRRRFGVGSWLRHLEHVQPVPRRLERREEKVGFNMVVEQVVSLQVSA